MIGSDSPSKLDINRSFSVLEEKKRKIDLEIDKRLREENEKR
jgi:hypothetical protein